MESAVINEYEYDKTMPNEAILTASDVEKSFLEVGKKLRASGGRSTNQSTRTS